MLIKIVFFRHVKYEIVFQIIVKLFFEKSYYQLMIDSSFELQIQDEELFDSNFHIFYSLK